MRRHLLLILVFQSFSIFAQKQFKIVSIDSNATSYVIKLKKIDSQTTTTVYSFKTRTSTGNKIEIGKLYNFSFVSKFRMGTPELRYDADGKEKFLSKKAKFKRDNTEFSYSVSELDGIYYCGGR